MPPQGGLLKTRQELRGWQREVVVPSRAGADAWLLGARGHTGARTP